jgi:hypothetical protein
MVDRCEPPDTAQRYATVLYRIWHVDGRVTAERAIGLSQIAAYYPDALSVVRLDEKQPDGAFW